MTSLVTIVLLRNRPNVRRRERCSHGSRAQGTDPEPGGAGLRTFSDPGISTVLWTSVGSRQWTALLDVLEPKLTRPDDRALYDAVRTFPNTPDKLCTDPTISRLGKPGSAVADPRDRKAALYRQPSDFQDSG